MLLVLGAFYFLRNVLHGFRIGEATSFFVTVLSLNAYMIVRMVTSGIKIYEQETGTEEDIGSNYLLLALQLVLIAMGLIGSIFCCCLISVIIPIIYEDTKNNIFMHLDGNN